MQEAQNKVESAFTQTSSMRLKYGALEGHRYSDPHRKAVSHKLLQHMSVFHNEVVERKEIAKGILAKEHIGNRKLLNLNKFAEDSLDMNQPKYFNHRSEGSIQEIFLILGETIKEEIPYLLVYKSTFYCQKSAQKNRPRLIHESYTNT